MVFTFDLLQQVVFCHVRLTDLLTIRNRSGSEYTRILTGCTGWEQLSNGNNDMRKVLTSKLGFKFKSSLFFSNFKKKKFLLQASKSGDTEFPTIDSDKLSIQHTSRFRKGKYFTDGSISPQPRNQWAPKFPIPSPVKRQAVKVNRPPSKALWSLKASCSSTQTLLSFRLWKNFTL